MQDKFSLYEELENLLLLSVMIDLCALLTIFS